LGIAVIRDGGLI